MSATTTSTGVVLEPAAQAFADATAKPPLLYELTPTKRARSSTTSRPLPSTSCRSTSAGPLARGPLPVAVEQGYAVARWIAREGPAHELDPDRMAVAGDSVGGCMTAALTLMARERGDVRFVHQSMYYPVTDAAMDTGSYAQFVEGYYLTAKAMAWFWDCYCPDVERRSEPFASPPRARDSDLSDLPPALVLVDEGDVLRDEGEAYGARLRAAGVAVTTVRYDGIIHDFMMLNPLSATQATRGAVPQAIAVLRQALHTA